MEEDDEQVTSALRDAGECARLKYGSGARIERAVETLGEGASRCCSEAAVSCVSEEKSLIGTYDFPINVQEVSIDDYTISDDISSMESINYREPNSHSLSNQLRYNFKNCGFTYIRVNTRRLGSLERDLMLPLRSI
jgi:hypothetical protein